jgi:phosphoribosylanthranilate isomerase
MERRIWKVCGMREPDNIRELAALRPDYMGFIFYEKSSRYVLPILNPEHLNVLSPETQRVGVFVNEPLSVILERAKQFSLSVIQLHGHEKPELAKALKEEGLKVWKAFSIKGAEDFAKTQDYAAMTDAFLFDTFTEHYGGSGKTFDWGLLANYSLSHPFLLSGGIGPDSLHALHAFQHPAWLGIDINSRFELAPGNKDIQAITSFIHAFKNGKE